MGYKSFEIYDDAFSPTFSQGDALLFKTHVKAVQTPGSIVLFVQNQEFYIGTVVESTAETTQIVPVVEPNASLTTTIGAQQIIGVYVSRVPLIGYPIVIMSSTLVKLVVLYILLCAMFWIILLVNDELKRVEKLTEPFD